MMLFLLSLINLASGCGEQKDAGVPVEPSAERYAVRGVLIRLPEKDAMAQIRHEAIVNFRSREGQQVGMDTMTMPFPVAEGVSLEGLKAGDPVFFEFEVRWQGRPPYQLVHIERLPEGAVLNWESLHKEGEGSGQDAGHGHVHD